MTKLKSAVARAIATGISLSLAALLAACSGPHESSNGGAPGPTPAVPTATAKPSLKSTLSEPPVPDAAIPSGPAKRPYRIAVSLLTRDDEFYKDLEQGMKSEAGDRKVEITVMSAEKDLNKQINQVQNFVAQRMDAIILCPVDSQGIISAVVAANNAGIPVFTADIASKGGKVVCHVASDNVQGGRLDGNFVVKQLKGKGNVAILDLRTVTSVQDRVKGFKDALLTAPGIKIVADEDVEGAKRENAVPKATNVLTAHPEINVIFGINDPVALGALSTLQQLKRTDVMVVGFDAVPEAQSYIAAGSQLKADAIQYPKVMGRAAVDVVIKSLNGETTPTAIPIPTGLIEASSFARK